MQKKFVLICLASIIVLVVIEIVDLAPIAHNDYAIAT